MRGYSCLACGKGGGEQPGASTTERERESELCWVCVVSGWRAWASRWRGKTCYSTATTQTRPARSLPYCLHFPYCSTATTRTKPARSPSLLFEQPLGRGRPGPFPYCFHFFSPLFDQQIGGQCDPGAVHFRAKVENGSHANWTWLHAPCNASLASWLHAM